MRPELENRLTEAMASAESSEPAPLREWLAEIEAWRIRHALERNHFNRTSAARELGIGRRTLYTKMEKLGIAPRNGLVGITPQSISV